MYGVRGQGLSLRLFNAEEGDEQGSFPRFFSTGLASNPIHLSAQSALNLQSVSYRQIGNVQPPDQNFLFKPLHIQREGELARIILE
ncbi:hypothetical protein D1872_326540 [compost metagenome]